MKTYCPIKLGIGSAAAEPLSQEFYEFYQWITSKYLDVSCRILQEAERATIPITNEDIQNRPFTIYELIHNYFKRLARIPDVTVVDLAGPHQGVFRGALLLHLGHVIRALNDSSDTYEMRFIIMLPDLPHEEDHFIRELSPLIQANRVLIIDDNGCYIAGAAFSMQLESEDYKVKLANLRRNPLELLNLKTVRRLGHFGRKSNGRIVACKRYFYDAAKAVGEIADLISDKIYKITSEFDLPTIIYHSPISPWLSEAIYAVEQELKIQCFSVNSFLRKRKYHHIKYILLVTDLVDTGDTLKGIYKDIKQAVPSARLFAVTILTTKTKDEENLSRSLRIDSKNLEVECLMKVTQEEARPKDCLMCSSKLPYSNYQDEDYDMLTTYDMWEMNESAGYKQEQDVPKNRSSLGTVPNYPKMIQKYGSWIVYKIEKLLLSQGYYSADPVIVCPKELAPIFFANYLNLILGATVIQVPRSILDDIAEANFDVKLLKNAWEAEAETWFLQLQSLATDQVILMDEFNASGGTYKAMSVLVKHFDLTSLCFFPLIDFNPNESVQFSIPVVSLYQFQRFYNQI